MMNGRGRARARGQGEEDREKRWRILSVCMCGRVLTVRVCERESFVVSSLCERGS